MKIRYIIVDDEPLARKLIQSHAAKIEMLDEVGVCKNAIEAMNIIRKQSVDLIFLDIQMPELNGLDFVKTLNQRPSIILTTAYREFAADAFELDIIDYLVKPISFERFIKAINKLTSQPTLKPQREEPITDTFLVRADRKFYPISIMDIYFIESLDSFVRIYLKDKSIVTHENISSLESRLPAESFIRIHRSFIINRKYITAMTSEYVMISNKELPFGRTFKQLAIKQLGI